MTRLSSDLYKLLGEKKSIYIQMGEIFKRQITAANTENWTLFNELAESFQKLALEAEKLEEPLEGCLNRAKNTKELRKLEDELAEAIKSCLLLQQQAVKAVELKKMQALGQIQMLDRKSNAFQAYGRSFKFQKSQSKFIDDKK